MFRFNQGLTNEKEEHMYKMPLLFYRLDSFLCLGEG